MDLWERWSQCKSCYYEHGLNEVVGIDNDGKILQEYRYECSAGENCDSDFKCNKFNEDE